MSWLFSQALAAEYLEESCSDGEQFAPLNVMPTAHPFWLKDKTMEPSSLSLFGLTCKVLTEDRGEELLTSFLGAFRASISLVPVKKPESTASTADSGEKWRGSLAKFDRDSYSWKTAQTSLLEDSTKSSLILPRSGSMRNGGLFPAQKSARPRYAKDFGLLPTPTATDYKGSTPYQVQRRDRKANGYTLREWLAKYSEAEETIYPNPGFLEKMQGFPPGWTALEPLEMPRYQQWLETHS